MPTKWLLIALPLGILGVLFQSAFWVPTYASQAEGNPARLVTFLRAEIGDAKTLNSIILNEKFAREIVDPNISEGLMREDENLKASPGLALRHETTEEAYLAVLPERKLSSGTPATGPGLLLALETAWKGGQLGEVSSSIRGIELVAAETRRLTESVLVKNAKGKQDPVDVALTVSMPERIKLHLSKVEPRLFQQLEIVVGKSYFENYPLDARFKLSKPELLPQLQPRFPELLPIGEHNPIITFYMRPHVHWHDGVPLTAADVKFTYEAIMNPKNMSPRVGEFGTIKQVEVVGELTVRVVYKRLHAQGILAWLYGLIPKHLLDDAALEREANRRGLSGEERKKLSVRTSEFNRAPVGTGPFRFVEWRAEQYIHLARNEQYWGQKAGYGDLYFRIIPDYLTTELEFAAGALDVYLAQPHQAARYRSDTNYQVLPNNEGNYTYIGYNMRRPLFKDVRVRRALGMAIDVNSIIEHVVSGEGKPATGPYYSTTPYFDPDVKPLPYDPKAALALLNEAGWYKNARGVLEKDGKPFEFTLVTNNANPQRKAIMVIAQEAWRKLGIDCKVQAFEWTVFIEDFVHKNNFDAYVLGWAGGAISPDKFGLFHSSNSQPYQPNYVGYQSAETDALLVEIRETYDEAELIQLTRKLHRLLARDQPYTFIYEPIRPFVIDRRIQRWQRLADGSEVARKLETPRSGNVFQFLSEWRKSSSAPLESAQ